LKLTDTQLKSYIKDGTLTQAQYDDVKAKQQMADNIANGGYAKVPDGAKSQAAQTFFRTFNSMDSQQQDKWLNGPADQNSVQIADALNKERSKGLPAFKPSNKLAQLYAKYEDNINSHPEYTAIDKRNKAKSFQIAATKLNYNQNVQDIFSEGGSSDLKTLIANKKITQDDMNAAIELDNVLFAAGLESRLKFSKTFRNSYGFATPTTGGDANTTGGGSGKHVSQQLASLVKTFNGTPINKASKPDFSAAARANPVSLVKFRSPSNVIPAKGSKRVYAAPFQTKTTRSLMNEFNP